MRRAHILMLLFLVTGLSGCVDDNAEDDGDTDDNGTPTNTGQNNTTEPETVNVSVRLSGAYPATIAYDPSTISVPVGSTVNLTFTNSDVVPVFSHDWVLEGYEETASTEVVGNGQSSMVSFEAPPAGSYTFYCSVPGHRDNGMEGTFTVE